MKTIGFLLLLVAADSYATIIDAAPFKDSVMSHCGSEKTPQLKRDCVVNASLDFSYVKKIITTDHGKGAVALCATSVDVTLPSGTHDMIRCASKHYRLRESHPDPKWLDWSLKISTLRPVWLKQCVKATGKNVSACMAKKRVGVLYVLA